MTTLAPPKQETVAKHTHFDKGAFMPNNDIRAHLVSAKTS